MKKIISLGVILGGILMFLFTGATAMADNTSSVTVSGICSSNSMHDITGILNWASCLLYKSVVPLLFAIATVAFIWGVIQFYLNPDNEEKRKKGKSFIIGGLIALFVMVAMWGLVGILTNTFQVGNTIPQLPGQ